MHSKLLTPAIFAWFAATFACGLGAVTVFGPIAVLLMGFILSADRSKLNDRFDNVMVTLITASGIFVGLWL